MLEILKQRRSIRRYQSTEISEDNLQRIIQAGLMAPSSRDRKPWEFIVVRDKETLRLLADCRKPSNTFMPKVPAIIVVMGDREKADTWAIDCSIAAAYLQLQAHSLGIGSCWIHILNRISNVEEQASDVFVRKILNIPDNFGILSILTLGYPDEQKSDYELDNLDYSKIHQEHF